MTLDRSHDAQRSSWVASAQADGTDFPIQNLPYGRFRRAGSQEPWRIGVAIGDQILDLAAARPAPGWPAELAPQLDALAGGDLAAVMAAPKATRVALRLALSDALAAGSTQQAALAHALVPQSAAEMTLPCPIGDYTDFYASIHHATTIGRMFRPDNPLLPNYRWVPIGYHGRASSINVSGTPIRRPLGQTKPAGSPPEAPPVFGPCQRLDYELELGAFVAQGNTQGEPVPLAQAEDRLAGMVLLNDWSARDIQAWEYQPLGPFLSKNFGSTISPWLVTMEALAPYRVPFVRAAGEPDPLPHLDSPANRETGAIDLTIEVWLQTAAMRERGEAAVRLSRGNFKESYWTLAQLLTHHASNGCNLATGDLLGTGTQSGPKPEEAGSLLELSMGGKTPVALPGGETRSFLADGDTLTLRAYAQKQGGPRIGFGDCSGTVLPSPKLG
ncbi:fumarylacetoacetase [Ideonella sp. DXS22W]|uniref:fumarylacetoacetase n=1 Tax=Pseudaquabacterium inlustre TaxID=2984192 RepID=A0ABU9CHQ0_9BURK